jgi:activator of HSP90 ATPase
MAIAFEVSARFRASADKLYTAWLDSGEHARMTGAGASVSAEIGGSFTAWDGYIEGRNLELEYPKRILQSWRTTEFEDGDEDSILEVLFQPEGVRTLVTIRHSNLPQHGMQYQQGWVDSYFEPMKEYFSGD